MSDPVPPHRRTWARRHGVLLVAVAATVALGIDGGYQIYAARISHQNAQAVETSKANAKKLARLSPAVCAQTRLFYDVFNALVLDTGPRFGSPPDGTPIPGARDALIHRLYGAERAAAGPLRRQGCRISTP